MLAFLLALVDQAEAAAEPAAPPNLLTSLGPMLPLIGVGFIFYFLMIRPMKKQERDRQSLLSNLKKNDRVVTSGGIIAVISGIRDKDEEVTLKVDENSNVRLRVTKASIVRVLTEPEANKEATESKV